MNLKLFKPLLLLIAAAIGFFIVHKLVFAYYNIDETDFRFSLVVLYCIFLTLSLIICVVVLLVNKKNTDIVGMAFLTATSAKMLVCYMFLYPILNKQVGLTTEKTNFLVMFLLFMLTETLFTIRLLNNEKKNNN